MTHKITRNLLGLQRLLALVLLATRRLAIPKSSGSQLPPGSVAPLY